MTSWTSTMAALASILVLDLAAGRRRGGAESSASVPRATVDGQPISAGIPTAKDKCDGTESWVGSVDPDGRCHVAPDEVDPCDSTYWINPHVRPFQNDEAVEARISESADFSMRQVICYGIKYLGSRDAALEEIVSADSSTFRINNTQWNFVFPHENYRRIFFSESKILNADQHFSERVENEMKRMKRKRGPGSCPPELGETACSWARTLGNGIPMIMDKLPKDSTGIMIDTGIHVGTETVYLAKKFPNVHIYSVEPSRRNCFYIMWNLLLNGIDPSRITLLHKFFGAELKSDTKLIDWGMRQGGSEGAWARHADDVVQEDGEVYTVKKKQADPSKPDLWRQGTVDTVGTITLRAILDMAKKDHGTDRALFLRLNCEGCEFEVVPNQDFRLLAKNNIDFIGGEIHSSCRAELTKIGPSLEQSMLQGAAMNGRNIAATFKLLCTDELFPAEKRDFFCDICTPAFWDSIKGVQI